MERPSPLRIRLLGELQLVGGNGLALALPPSRKTRALLGYLIATSQPHRRERLCDLFWDGPDDPRAELRWSLSKIRSLLDDSTGVRLAADRERVGIELGHVVVDLAAARSLLGGELSTTPTDALKEAAALLGGEFLDGLDLPLCYRYQEWCLAEREAVNRLRLTVLASLVQRLGDRPADALVYAHSLAIADPLSESGHAAVVRLLSRLGRKREAHHHYEHARRLLESELGIVPSEELEEARRALPLAAGERSQAQALHPAPTSTAMPASAPPREAHFVGRATERATIEHIVMAAVEKRTSDAVLVTGEPGIGKSHLLSHIGERMIAAGGLAFSARAFEAETARSYGIWIDLLRAMLRARPHDGPPSRLGLLLPEFGAPGSDPEDRGQLFDAVVDLLREMASENAFTILLDDIHWLDEASSSLLHYVTRHIDATPGLLIACAARTGEIDDNATAARVLRSLLREGHLRTIELSALSAAETTELVRRFAPGLDAERIFAESDGNPLFSLELARSHYQGDIGPGRSVATLVAGQLARLTDDLRETLLWAAALGRAFTPDDLANAMHLHAAKLLMALGELERRGLVYPVGDDAFDFTHDLVRQTTYRTLSPPRRRLLHRHLAHRLNAVAGADGALAADVVHHAALAGEHELTAQASVFAGDRALRLFAGREASGFAERGLRHIERLPDGPAKMGLRIALLRICVLAAMGPGLRSLPPFAEAIAEATRAAEEWGLQAEAATGHYLLSVLHQEAGDVQRAERSTLRAAEAGRAADDATRAHQLANTARCLLELETEVGRSRELIAEAGVIGDSLGLNLCELHWARGLLYRWDGGAEEATASLTRALTLARRSDDHWREYKCLTWLAMLEYEAGRIGGVRTRCEELRTVAARLREDETPFVQTLEALSSLASADPSGDALLENALALLRTVDDKSYLAYALNSAALLYRRMGRGDRAERSAAEALQVASIMDRRNEIVIARAILAPVDAHAPAGPGDYFAAASSIPDDLGARARAVLFGLPPPPNTIPTIVPTPERRN